MVVKYNILLALKASVRDNLGTETWSTFPLEDFVHDRFFQDYQEFAERCLDDNPNFKVLSECDIVQKEPIGDIPYLNLNYGINRQNLQQLLVNIFQAEEHEYKCVFCNESFDSKDLAIHITEFHHFTFPELLKLE